MVVTDLNPYRLELARKLGATRAVDVARETLDDVMQEPRDDRRLRRGDGDVRKRRAFRDLLSVMNHGGRVAILGIPPNEVSIDWNQVIFKGLVLKGVYGREMFETWYKMVAMLQSGLDVAPVVTHRFPAARYAEAFEAMRSGQSGKVILDWVG